MEDYGTDVGYTGPDCDGCKLVLEEEKGSALCDLRCPFLKEKVNAK